MDKNSKHGSTALGNNGRGPRSTYRNFTLKRKSSTGQSHGDGTKSPGDGTESTVDVTKYHKSSEETLTFAHNVDLLTYLKTFFSQQSWPTDEELTRLKKQQPSGIEEAVPLARYVVSDWEKLFGQLPSNPEPNYTEVRVWLHGLTYHILKMMAKETQSFPERYWNEFSILTQEILFNHALLDSWNPIHYQLYQLQFLGQELAFMPGGVRKLVHEYAEEKCTDPYCIQRFPDCSGQPDKCCPECVALVKTDVNDYELLKRPPSHADHRVCFECAPSESDSEHQDDDSILPLGSDETQETVHHTLRSKTHLDHSVCDK